MDDEQDSDLQAMPQHLRQPIDAAVAMTEPGVQVPAWTIKGDEPPAQIGEIAKHFTRTNAVAGRSYDEFAANWQRHFPGLDTPDKQDYSTWEKRAPTERMLDMVRSQAARDIPDLQGQAVLPGSQDWQLENTRLAQAFPPVQWGMDLAYKGAMRRYERGEADGKDLGIIARVERQHELRAADETGFMGKLRGLSLGTPFALAEMGIGGKAGQGLGAGLTPAALANAPGVGAGVARFAIGAGATAAAFPSMGPRAIADIMADPRDAPREAMQTIGRALVMHGVGQIQGAIGNLGGSPAAQMTASALAFPGGNAAMDAVNHVLGLQSGWGPMGDLLKEGHRGEGVAELLIGGLQGIALAGLTHGKEAAKGAADQFAGDVKAAQEAGATPAQAVQQAAASLNNLYRVPNYKGEGGNVELAMREFRDPSFAGKFVSKGAERNEGYFGEGRVQFEFDPSKLGPDDNVQVGERDGTIGSTTSMREHPALVAVRYKGSESSDDFKFIKEKVDIANELRAGKGLPPIQLKTIEKAKAPADVEARNEAQKHPLVRSGLFDDNATAAEFAKDAGTVKTMRDVYNVAGQYQQSPEERQQMLAYLQAKLPKAAPPTGTENPRQQADRMEAELNAERKRLTDERLSPKVINAQLRDREKELDTARVAAADWERKQLPVAPQQRALPPAEPAPAEPAAPPEAPPPEPAAQAQAGAPEPAAAAAEPPAPERGAGRVPLDVVKRPEPEMAPPARDLSKLEQQSILPEPVDGDALSKAYEKADLSNRDRDIHARYSSGESVDDIGADYGVSGAAIHKRLKKIDKQLPDEFAGEKVRARLQETSKAAEVSATQMEKASRAELRAKEGREIREQQEELASVADESIAKAREAEDVAFTAEENRLGPSAKPNERAEYSRGSTPEYKKQDILQRSWGARTLYQEVLSRGGLNVESLRNNGIDVDALKESGFPRPLLNYQKGLKIDELADEYFGEGKEYQPFGRLENDAQGPEKIIDLLRDHAMLDHGGWLARKADLADMANELEERRARQEAAAQGADERAIAEAASGRGEAPPAERASDEVGTTDDTGAEPGFFDVAELEREPAAQPPGQAPNGAAVDPARPASRDPILKAARDLLVEEGAFYTPGIWFGKLFALYTHMRDGVRDALDTWSELAGKMGPRTTKLDRDSGEALARFNAAGTYSRLAAPKFIDDVVGEKASPADRQLWGTAFQEIRHRYAKLNDSAPNAKTFVGQANSPLKTEADFRRLVDWDAIARVPADMIDVKVVIDAIRDPAFKGVLERWRDRFVPEMERNYRGAQGIDPADPIDVETQIPGLPMNAKPVREGDPVAPSVVGTPGRGNLKNLKTRRLPFAERAGLDADRYDTDLGAIIENSLYRSVQIARKAEWYRQMVDGGIAKWGARGQQVEGMRELPFTTPPRKTQDAEPGDVLYVHDRVHGEAVQALNVERAFRIPVLTPLMQAFTKAALASTVEMAYHSKNLLTFMSKPGVSPVDLVTNAWKVISRDKGARDRVVELARIGALKDHGFREAGLLPGEAVNSPFNPLRWPRMALDALDRTMRLTAEDAFNRLAKKTWYAPDGRVMNTETAKRDFINQLGQYEIKAQNQLVRLLRDSGLGPFATAGTNFYVQGLRALTLNPGAKATSAAQAVGLRAEYLARMGSVVAASALANYLMWGRADGDDKTPLGAIKMSEGKGGRTGFIDMTNFTGLTRGAREVGLLALGERMRKGPIDVKSENKAYQSAWRAILHPAIGPGVQAAEIAYSGEGYAHQNLTDAQTAAKSSPFEKMWAALRNANPIIATVGGYKHPGRAVPADEQINELLGPFGEQYRYPIGHKYPVKRKEPATP